MKKYSKYVNTEAMKKARIKQKKNCRAMANELGFKSEVSYYNIELGIVEPKITQMVKIAHILKGPVQKFFNLKLQEN